MIVAAGSETVQRGSVSARLAACRHRRSTQSGLPRADNQLRRGMANGRSGPGEPARTSARYGTSTSVSRFRFDHLGRCAGLHAVIPTWALLSARDRRGATSEAASGAFADRIDSVAMGGGSR
jgi:hypothetical protein